MRPRTSEVLFCYSCAGSSWGTGKVGVSRLPRSGGSLARAPKVVGSVDRARAQRSEQRSRSRIVDGVRRLQISGEDKLERG